MSATQIAVYHNPDHCLVIVAVNGVVVKSSGKGYVGMSYTEALSAGCSVMRYEDGTEPQPNTGHSANGYATLTELTL